MKITESIKEIDVHGLTAEAAVARVEGLINRAEAGTYRIRVIHGFNRGNNIQKAIYRELGHGLNSKVIRIEGGSNPGITEIVLKEWY